MKLIDLLEYDLDDAMANGLLRGYEIQTDNTNGTEKMPRIILHFISDEIYAVFNKIRPEIYNESNFTEDGLGGSHTYGYVYMPKRNLIDFYGDFAVDLLLAQCEMIRKKASRKMFAAIMANAENATII